MGIKPGTYFYCFQRKKEIEIEMIMAGKKREMKLNEEEGTKHGESETDQVRLCPSCERSSVSVSVSVLFFDY